MIYYYDMLPIGEPLKNTREGDPPLIYATARRVMPRDTRDPWNCHKRYRISRRRYYRPYVVLSQVTAGLKFETFAKDKPFSYDIILFWRPTTDCCYTKTHTNLNEKKNSFIAVSHVPEIKNNISTRRYFDKVVGEWCTTFSTVHPWKMPHAAATFQMTL